MTPRPGATWHSMKDGCCSESEPAGRESVRWAGEARPGLAALGAGQVLLEDLAGLGGYSVREADFELHNQVSALGGHLGERQPLPSQPLHGARLDDVAAGQGDDAPVHRGDVDGAAAQGLQERRREAGETAVTRAHQCRSVSQGWATMATLGLVDLNSQNS